MAPVGSGAAAARVGLRIVAKKGGWVLRREPGTRRARTFELKGGGGSVVIGRKEGAILLSDDSAVSSRHAELSFGAKSLWIEDLGSTNGTTVNGVQIRSKGKVKLLAGDVVEVGDSTLLVEDAEAAEAREAEEAAEAAPPPAPPPPKSIGGVAAADVKLGPLIAKGSFGSVFRGEWRGAPVILKTANARVENAAALLAVEAAVNERAATAARGACAAFLGAVDVGAREAGAAYAGRLPEGLWLCWREQGRRTLENFLSGARGLDELGAALGVDTAAAASAEGGVAAAVAAEALRQLLRRLQALHAAGIVHRDVKPANILLDEEGGQLVLIDLGAAAACLGMPVGVGAPGTGPFDPIYAPPERYAFPAGAPGANVMTAPVLWKLHTPELLDTYAAGVVLLRLALPALRPERAARALRDGLDAAGGDLRAWREANPRAVGDDAALAARGGAGWALAERLLTADRAAKGGRMKAADALQHPFLAPPGGKKGR